MAITAESASERILKIGELATCPARVRVQWQEYSVLFFDSRGKSKQ